MNISYFYVFEVIIRTFKTTQRSWNQVGFCIDQKPTPSHTLPSEKSKNKYMFITCVVGALYVRE